MPRQDIAQSSWHDYRRNRVITFHDSCLAVDSLFMYKVPFEVQSDLILTSGVNLIELCQIIYSNVASVQKSYRKRGYHGRKQP